MIDQTHDRSRVSWVESANDPESDFPLQNLPFGVFRRAGTAEAPRVGVAIGDQIFDVSACPLLRSRAALACAAPCLNRLMALGPADWGGLRKQLSHVLSNEPSQSGRLTPMAEAEMFLAAEIGDYTDFYASIFHATNVGRLFRPDNPLLPNYKYVPIAYHARASSVVVSGTPVRRPRGQTAVEGTPRFGETQSLDYEMELGFFVGPGNALGQPIAAADAESHIFGVCLVNDWSARDIQAWEYQPLGPFLGKNFATTVSPWVVTMEALAPFRAPAFQRPAGDPAPLDYLLPAGEGVDVTLEVWLRTPRGSSPVLLSRGNARDLYWTLAQMLTHHASNGCNLRPGDLIASGTVSGATPDSLGCLLELTRRGSDPIALPSGETRRFLEDGDEVILRGWCRREGFARIGLGECRGVVYR